MAAIALPKLKLPAFAAPAIDLRALIRNPKIGLGFAALVFAGAVVALIRLLGPMGGQDHMTQSLEPVFKAAPAGWLSALKPSQSMPHE